MVFGYLEPFNSRYDCVDFNLGRSLVKEMPSKAGSCGTVRVGKVLLIFHAFADDAAWVVSERDSLESLSSHRLLGEIVVGKE